MLNEPVKYWFLFPSFSRAEGNFRAKLHSLLGSADIGAIGRGTQQASRVALRGYFIHCVLILVSTLPCHHQPPLFLYRKSQDTCPTMLEWQKSKERVEGTGSNFIGIATLDDRIPTSQQNGSERFPVAFRS